MKCQSIKNNVKKVCTTDFNKKIIIEKYGSYGNNSPNADAILTYQTVATVFAMVKTSANGDFVNNVNVSNTITIDFYIRYNSAIDISQQLFVLLDNKRYKIELVDDIDKDNKIIRLRAKELGLSTLQANKV
jgi:SPP1 family predicted phage head-tail adaptor